MDCGIDENLIDWDQSYTLSFYCKRETKLVNLIYNLNSFTEGLPPIVIGGGGGGVGVLKGHVVSFTTIHGPLRRQAAVLPGVSCKRSTFVSPAFPDP